MSDDFDFRSIYRHGFARVASCTIRSQVADPAANAAAVLDVARACHDKAVAVAVFPELCLSGYAIEDLLMQDVLLDGVEHALATLAEETADLLPVLIVGAPLRHGSRLYNAACVLHRGRLLGVVPKVYLPTYREFYEARHFASGSGAPVGPIRVGALEAPFGTNLLFAAEDVPGLTVGVEICEDMWIPVPPAARLALEGASVLANLSGSPITIGRARSRSLLCQSSSMRYNAAYIYAAGGAGESTTDLGWDGQTSIHEAGVLLAEGERFARDAVVTVADLDLDLIRQERASMGTFEDNRRVAAGEGEAVVLIPFRLDPPRGDVGFERVLERFPFVPADEARLAEDCYEGYNIQVAGLEQRLRATGTKRVVIGVSGGLDSTHALIVTAAAFDRLGVPRADILAYTMPGFGTSDETKRNALRLMSALGVSQSELDIRPTATLMLQTMDHPFGRGEPVYDTTFENVQAGLRTDYLFRLANQHGGIVIGTGDLSELALGWCTYGVGDQMSHYNVNAGVPKTLIQHLIRWVATSGEFEREAGAVLLDVLNTEISPELIPAEAGNIQSTQEKIGPYELQDFNLFYVLRYGMRPSKIVFLAEQAWGDAGSGPWPPAFPVEGRRAYDRATIRRWMTVFLQRFFGFAQFKRSALPNGPKVSAGGSLSPRGDWRAPSDGSAKPWLAELERNVPADL